MPTGLLLTGICLLTVGTEGVVTTLHPHTTAYAVDGFMPILQMVN
jgi:hypothetical protein